MIRADRSIDEKGYTLIEMLIAIAIGAIVLYGAMQAFKTLSGSYESAKLGTELQQNVRSTVEEITRLTSMAGFYGGCAAPPDTHVHGLVFKRSYDPDPVDHVQFTTDGVTSDTEQVSGPDTLCFTIWDDDKGYYETIDETHYAREKRIRIYHDSVNKRVLARIERLVKSSWPDPLEKDMFVVMPGDPIILAENITQLEFRYYDASNTDVTGGLDINNIDDVRKVEVIVTGQTSRPDPSGRSSSNPQGVYRTFSLMSDIRPINLGLEGQTGNTKPPDAPTGITAIDPHVCGQIKLHWHANPEVDIAGYKVYRGLDSSVSDAPIQFGNVTSCTVSVMANNTDYYFAVAAYDTSGNYSNPISDAIHTGTFTDGVQNDTTANPDKPSVAPVNFKAVDGPGNEQITLTWSKHPDPDVTKYEIYRKRIDDTSNIVDFTYPAVSTTADVTKLVDKADFDTLVTTTGSTYTFIDSGLIGCRMYDYVIVPLTSCDNPPDDPPLKDSYAQELFARAYGDGDLIGNGSPMNDSVPSDDVVPASPVQFVAIPGASRVFLSWMNPDDKDIDRIQIMRSTTGFPASLGALGSVLAYDSDGMGVAYNPAPGASNTTIDASGVTDGICYYYTAFAVDRCLHVCATGTRSKNSVDGDEACALPCDDDPDGPPKSPPAATYTVGYCSSPEKLVIRWGDYGMPSAQVMDKDSIGYNVYRAIGGTATHTEPVRLPNLKGTSGYNVYSDAGATEGEIFTYFVRHEDCSNILSPIDEVTDLITYPGKVFYRSWPTRASGPYYNTIRVTSGNSSRWNAMLNGITLTWSGGGKETDVFLKTVQIYDAVTFSTVYDGNATSGSFIPFSAGNKSYDARYLRQATSTTAQPNSTMLFTFVDKNGKVNRTADMREASMTISYDFDLFYHKGGVPYKQDDTLVNCQPKIYPIRKPTGPTFMSVTQSTPVNGTTSVTDTGLIRIPADAKTDVTAYVTDFSSSVGGMKYVAVYYAFTNRTTSRPPSVGSLPDNVNLKTSSNPTGFTMITSVAVNPGSDFVQYRTTYNSNGHPIPASNNSRVWYFLVAKDKEDSYTRWPEQAEPDAVFNYDQNPALVIGGSGSGAGVTGVTASFVSPLNNAHVSGTVPISVTAVTIPSGNTIDSIQLMFGSDGIWHDCVKSGANWTYNWVTDPAELTDTTHTITATALSGSVTGTAGISVVVNNTPILSCSVTAPSGTVSGTEDVQINATATPGTPDKVEARIDSGTWIDVTSSLSGGLYHYSWDTTNETNASHTITGRVTEGAAVVTSSVVTVTVNNTGLICGIVQPLTGGTVMGTYLVQVRASTDVGTIGDVEVKIDSGAWVSIFADRISGTNVSGIYQYSWVTTALVDGSSHTVYARAKKGSSYANASALVTVNNTPVVTCSIYSPASAATLSGVVAVKVSATSDPSPPDSVQVSIDGGAWQAATLNGSYYDYSWDTSLLADTSHTIAARATKGVVTTNAASRTVLTDNSPGVSCTIVSPATGSDLSGTVQVKVSATGPPTYVYVFVDSGAELDITSSLSGGFYWYNLDTTALSTGTHAINVHVTRPLFGNSATTSVTVNVDNNPHVSCAITAPTDGSTVWGTKTVTVAASSVPSPPEMVEVQIDGGSWNNITASASGGNYTYSWNTSGYGENTNHTVTARTTKGTTTATDTVTVTKTAGTVSMSIAYPTSDIVISNDYTVKVQASTTAGTISSVSTSFDNVSWDACIYNAGTGYYERTYTVISPSLCQPRTLYAKAVNSQSVQATAQVSYTVDTTDTSTMLCDIKNLTAGQQLPGIYVVVRPPVKVVTIDASSMGAAATGVDVRVDGGPWAAATLTTAPMWSFDWTLPEGETNDTHSVQARSKVTSTCIPTVEKISAAVSVKVDTKVPTISLVNVAGFLRSGNTDVPKTYTTVSTDASLPTYFYRSTAFTWSITVTDTGGSGVKTLKMTYNAGGTATTTTQNISGDGTYYFTGTMPTNNKTAAFTFEVTDVAGNYAQLPASLAIYQMMSN